MKREQLGQCGIAGSEIIERDTHAGSTEIVNYCLRRSNIFDECAFGDFNLQAARTKPCLAENRQNAQPKQRIAQLDRRYIEGENKVRGPCVGIKACTAEKMISQRIDEARFFRDRNEYARRNGPQVLAVPTRQR